MTSKISRVVLQPRDEVLLRALAQKVQVLSLTQIKDWFFKDATLQACWARVRGLVAAGYLRVVDKSGGLGLIITIGKKGIRELGTDTDQLPRINRNTLEHDLWVSDLRLHLETQMGVNCVVSEYQLKARKISKDTPDLVIDAEGAKIGIEVERSRKSFVTYRKRAKTVFTNYGLILYLWPEGRPEVKKSLDALRSNLPQLAGRILDASWEKFWGNPWDAKFTSSERSLTFSRIKERMPGIFAGLGDQEGLQQVTQEAAPSKNQDHKGYPGVAEPDSFVSYFPDPAPQRV